jgi:hypothetical protein
MKYVYAARSKVQAESFLKILGRVSGSGGKKCYSLVKKSKNWEIYFSPDVYKDIHPGMIQPNLSFLAGYLVGYSAKR